MATQFCCFWSFCRLDRQHKKIFCFFKDRLRSGWQEWLNRYQKEGSFGGWCAWRRASENCLSVNRWRAQSQADQTHWGPLELMVSSAKGKMRASGGIWRQVLCVALSCAASPCSVWTNPLCSSWRADIVTVYLIQRAQHAYFAFSQQLIT